MKKGLVLATILTLCSTTMVIAKEFNDARWQWFYSNANYTGKVDLNTLSYDPATDTATAWAVWLRTTGFQQLQSYTIHYKDSSINVREFYSYRTGSDEVLRHDYVDVSRKPAPDSGEEALITSVKGLVGRDTKLADYHKQQAEEVQIREQKRIDDQKVAEKKAKHERNRDILRGIFGI